MEASSTAILLSPVERIWQLLIDPRKLAQWTGTTLVEGPARPMIAGDHVALGLGGLRITFDVLDMHPQRGLTLKSRLPFGLANHEQIEITPIDAHSTRVTFSSHFVFPPGWRGQLVEAILGWRCATAPARSLRRLTRTAEQDPTLAR